MFQARNYIRPATLEEAYQLCQKRRNVVIGGMMWLKMENTAKDTVIDLSALGLDQIEETEEEFQIGCMTTLRMLETHPGLNREFNGVFRECTRHIVGVQFRNGATIGGSVYGRFGFSDIITCLMALDTEVELYHGGRMKLSQFAKKPLSVKDRDILVRIYVKKDGRKAAYQTMRQTRTDFPVIACCAAKCPDGSWQFAVGARPQIAQLAVFPAEECMTAAELAAKACAGFTYGTNLRATAQYRAYLAQVLLRRLIERMEADGAAGTQEES